MKEITGRDEDGKKTVGKVLGEESAGNDFTTRRVVEKERRKRRTKFSQVQRENRINRGKEMEDARSDEC